MRKLWDMNAISHGSIALAELAKCESVFSVQSPVNIQMKKGSFRGEKSMIENGRSENRTGSELAFSRVNSSSNKHV